MRSIWIAMLMLMLPAAASAEFFRYETEEGTLAFTDDEKRIPSRYRAHAVPEAPQSLLDYPRLTIAEVGATSVATTSWLEGLEEEEPSAAPSDTAPMGAGTIQIQSNPANVIFNVPADTDEPVFIERITEWRRVGSWLVPFMVVKRNGKVVAEIKLRDTPDVEW